MRPNLTKIKKAIRSHLKWALPLGGLLFALWFVPNVFSLQEGPITVTRWTKTRGEVQITLGPNEDNWIFGSDISHNILNAILIAEDSRFYTHRGLDFKEILLSIERNIRARAYVRGASTITQQVVKMTLLSREKTLTRKLREAAGAILLEWTMNKDRILEWYVNLAEFGDGVYGIANASKHYFDTKPELLTIAQGIHLALVLPGPNTWSKGLRNNSLTEFGHRRFHAIASRMKTAGFITEEQWLQTMATGDFGSPIVNEAK